MAIIINFSELKSKHELKASHERLNYDDEGIWDTWDEQLNLDEDELADTVLDSDFVKI